MVNTWGGALANWENLTLAPPTLDLPLLVYSSPGAFLPISLSLSNSNDPESTSHFVPFHSYPTEQRALLISPYKTGVRPHHNSPTEQLALLITVLEV